MNTSAVRVLTELVAQHEDEWEAETGAGRGGRCWYVARALIESGYFELPSVVLKPGEVLVLDAGPDCSMARAQAIKEQAKAAGIVALVTMGVATSVAVPSDGERRRTVVLTDEAWSHVLGALADGLAGCVLGYELRFGGSQLQDAVTEIERQVAP